MHSHTHGPASGRVLAWSLAATSAFVVIELIAGLRAHSLALISDAGHNATDALALLLAWFAVYMQYKPADESRTFGYHRAGVLAAFVNALGLIVLSAWMLYESWLRLMSPEAVDENLMLWVAGGGLLLNGGIMLGLQRSGSNDINIRGAFLHMLGDLLGAAAIIVGALVIRAIRMDSDRSVAVDTDFAADRLDRLGYYPRIAQHPARGIAARSGTETGDAGDLRGRRRSRRSRSAHLESRFKLACAQLSCADR